MRAARLMATATVALTATALSAGTATAATKPVTTAAAVVTTTHAITAHLVHPAGTLFTITGWVDGGTNKGVNKQKVYLLERADAHHKWVKATNIKVSWRVTSSPRAGVNGYVTFAGIKAAKHAEQYVILHPRQKVGAVMYGQSVSKVISVTP